MTAPSHLHYNHCVSEGFNYGMTIGLAFFHGWGLDSRFWRPLAKLLSHHPHVWMDAGYFGPVSSPDWHGATHWVGVGHSLGWVRALESPPPNGWSGLVSLCGFPRFCAKTKGDVGQPRRVIGRMVQTFENTPHDVLHDFLRRCDLLRLMPPSDAIWHTPRLSADLVRLASLDVNEVLAGYRSPLLALAALDDPIVPSALTASTFAQRPNTQLIWHAQGGHALGHVQASACARAVGDFMKTLDA